MTEVCAAMYRWSCSIAIAALLTAFQTSTAQAPPPPADGVTLLQAGKFEEARASFEATLTTTPQDQQAQDDEVKASEALALRERAAGNRVEALRALIRAQDFAPRNARLLFDLGILDEEMQLYRDADKALTQAIQIDPDNPQSYYGLARAQIYEGELDAAEQNMKTYLKARPGDASAHYGLGRIYQLGMRFDQARDEFQRSIDLQPVQTEAYYELGDIALKQNDYAAALGYFQKVLARDGKHGGALAGAGQAFFRQKQYPEALDNLRRAVAVAPDYQPGHYYLGLTLSRLGQKEESDKELLTAQKLADEDNKNGTRRFEVIREPPSH
ncbi:MAG TPA: tetratricopeptide repeat protein [Acidobacteriaceae bacterium]|jgi:tetratricopeptide (TPR) repeat protein